jgi:hypothetical protein
MSLTNLSSKELHRAANLKERIDELQSQLNALLGAATTEVTPPTHKRRRMSAAGRARISAAAKARWAKLRREKGGTAAGGGAKPKRRKMTAAGRARLAALVKERWRKAKLAGKAKL